MTTGLLPGDVPWALPEGPCYIVDIETDGLPDVYTRVHSLVVRDGRSGAVVFSMGGPSGVAPRDAELALAGASSIVAHNGFKFDFGALRDLLGWRPSEQQLCLDTLPLSRLVFSDIKSMDGDLLRKGVLPGKLFGAHSLKAWGYRLGEHKGDYQEEFQGDDPWARWSPEMQSYCEQDTQVTWALLQRILRVPTSARAVELELGAARICAGMEAAGFPFDRRLAEATVADLCVLRASLESQVRRELKGWWRPEVTEPVTPKKPRRQFLEHDLGLPVNRATKKAPDWRTGYFLEWSPDAPWTPMEWVEFNPGSRDQVAEFLKRRYGWEPEELTEGGKPKVDETTLGKLPWPEAKLLSRLFLVSKRLGQAAEGDQAWLKALKPDGAVHGAINPNGAVTGRATHFSPNIAQVPSVKLDKEGKVLLGEPGEWGFESRSMFRAPEGRVLIGADLSKLELLCLAHYTAYFDGGEYREIVLSADPHVFMQTAAGLPTRGGGKTMNYALVYGAGDAKLGSIAEPSAADQRKRQLGGQLRARVMKNFRGLGQVTEHLQSRVKQGWLFGLDGRRVTIRSQHAVVNTLLQSAGALVSKRWLIELETLCREHGIGWLLHAWVHDEVQFSVLPEHVEKAKELAVEAAARVGRYFKMNVPILAEAKHGRTWADTH